MNFVEWFKEKFKTLEHKDTIKERALMFDQVAQQISEWSYAESDRPYFTTFFLETGQLYGLFNKRDSLFKAGIDIDTDGETVVLGDMVPVVHEFTPVQRSSFTIMRQADGRVRFFMVAGTAIINRVNEIDSTKLYDDMIQRAEDDKFYPALDFYHLGEVNPRFEFGTFDFLAREGVVYLGSGLFEEDHPLSDATIRAVEAKGDDWGASIEYYRPKNRGIEYVTLRQGLEIAVFTEGLNTRISILPEEDCASWFTGLKTGENIMDAKKKRALKKLFADDVEGFEEFMEEIEDVNQTVKDKKLISRTSEQGSTSLPVGDKQPATPTNVVMPVAPAPPVSSAPTTASSEAQPIELDDTVLQEIVKIAKAQTDTEVVATVTRSLETITATLTGITEAQTNLLAAFNGMQERINELEKDEDVKQRKYIEELPSKKTINKVTYRPKKDVESEPVALTAAEQASKVLSNIPKAGGLK